MRVVNTGRAAGGSAKARSGTARGKREGFALRSSECAAQVIFGIGVTTRKAGATEPQHGLDLVGRETAAQKPLSDPQISDAPIGWRETLRNLQSVQPAGIDADSGGDGEGAGNRSGWRRRQTQGGRRQTDRPIIGWREAMPCTVKQRGGAGSQVGLSIHEPDPRRVAAGLAASGFLVGESSQSAEMTPVGGGAVCAVEVGQESGDGGSRSRIQRRGTDTDPGLQMAGASAQDGTRLMPVGAHPVEDVVVGAIEIDKEVTGVSSSGERPEEDIVPLAVTQPQKSEQRTMCELQRGPNLLCGKRSSSAAVNQTKLIIVAGHGRQLAAHGLQGNEQSPIHDRDSNIGSGSSPLKAEVLTLQKSGSFHFALTSALRLLTSF